MKLSIIVPVYNAAATLQKFLQSLLAASDKVKATDGKWSTEIILVDDCSTDGSLKILESSATLHSTFKLLHLPTNAGVSAARQAGLDMAQGEYVIFADPDDRVDPGMYEGLVETAERTGADFVWEDFWEGKAECRGGDGAWTRRDCSVADATGEGLIRAILTGRLHGATWNKLIRRSFVENCGARFLPGRVGMCEDVDFLCQVLMANPKCVYHHGCHYRYRVVEGSATHASRTWQMKSLRIVERHLETVLTTPRTRAVLRLWKFGNRASSVTGLKGKPVHLLYRLLRWWLLF